MVSTWGSPVERRSSIRSTRCPRLCVRTRCRHAGGFRAAWHPQAAIQPPTAMMRLASWALGTFLIGRPAPSSLSSAFSRTQHVMKTAMSASSIVATARRPPSRAYRQRVRHRFFRSSGSQRGAASMSCCQKRPSRICTLRPITVAYARPHAAKMRGTVPRQTAAPSCAWWTSSPCQSGTPHAKAEVPGDFEARRSGRPSGAYGMPQARSFPRARGS